MSGEYNFFAILVFTLSAYYASLILVRKKSITLLQHWKFWNVVLLISFFVSGTSGMLMSFLIDSNVHVPYYATILWLHVELGIEMAVVSVFHLFRHRQYFWKLKKTK